jgi:hypothetical protein
MTPELTLFLLLAMVGGFAALALIIILQLALRKQGHRTMSKIDDLTAAVADLQSALGDQFTAVDAEIAQLTAAIANSGLPADQQAALQSSIDNITAATTAMRESTAKLTADDAA